MTYKILLWANKERCDLDGYQQKIEVFFNGQHVSSWYSEKFEDNQELIDSSFDIFIMKKSVNAESPRIAILKFLKWYSNGLPENYLLELENKEIILTKSKEFEQHMKEASKIVQKWPEWKQKACGLNYKKDN